MLHVQEPNAIVPSDVCLIVMGVVCEREYIRCELSEDIKNENNMVHLELWTIVVAFKVWSHRITGLSVQIKYINKPTVHVLNME